MTDEYSTKVRVCSRCKKSEAEYQIDMKPVCRLCVTLWESIKRYNRDLFAKGSRQ